MVIEFTVPHPCKKRKDGATSVSACVHQRIPGFFCRNRGVSGGQMPLSPHAKDRVRLLLVAVGAVIIMLPIIWASGVLIPREYRDHINSKWARFTVVTILFVAYCLKTYWRARKHLRFWAILFGIFVLHFVGVGYLFYADAGLPLMLFGPTVALEWALLALAVYHVLGIGPPARKH